MAFTVIARRRNCRGVAVLCVGGGGKARRQDRRPRGCSVGGGVKTEHPRGSGVGVGVCLTVWVFFVSYVALSVCLVVLPFGSGHVDREVI